MQKAAGKMMSIQTVPTPTNVQNPNVYFRCFAGCAAKHSIFDVIYTCPSCGSLLEVHHEREPLKKRNAYQWQQLFDSRASTSIWPYGSGVWGMREWVIPTLA